MLENAKVGAKNALEKEIIIVEVRGLEIYVNTNMEIHGRIKK